MGSSGGLSRSKGNINSTRSKLKSSESIASSIASNIHRLGGPQDLSKILLTDDYFSDVNPRSMRRLMNIVYITGILIKNQTFVIVTNKTAIYVTFKDVY